MLFKKKSQKETIPEEIDEEKEKAKKLFYQDNFDKNTFITSTIFNKSDTFKAPFPIRLTKEQLTFKYNPDFLKDFLIKDNSGVYSLKQEIVDRQGGVIKDLVNQLTKSVVAQKHVTISLPIRIFEPLFCS